ncbi:hypothetical protein [Streptomyces sp. NPDC056921]
MITSATNQTSTPDAEYRTLLGHTYGCASCRLAPCPTAVRLTRAWRDARR